MPPRAIALCLLACLLAMPAASRQLTPRELELIAQLRALTPNNDAPVVSLLNLLQTGNMDQQEFIARYTATVQRQFQAQGVEWQPGPAESRSNRPIADPALITRMAEIAAQAYVASGGRPQVPTSGSSAQETADAVNELVDRHADVSMAEQIVRSAANATNIPLMLTAAATYARERADPVTAQKDYAAAVAAGDRSAGTLSGLAAAAYDNRDYAQARDAARMALDADPGHKGAQAVLKLTEGRVSDDAGAAAMSVATRGLPPGRSAPGGAGDASRLAPAGPRPGLTVASDAAQRAGAIVRAAAALSAAKGARQMRDLAAADRHATRALDADPENVPAHVFRSDVRGELGLDAASLQDAARALELAPTDAGAHVAARDALLRSRRYDEALRHADWVLERRPASAEAHARRAHALAGLGRRAEAVDALRRAAELDAGARALYDKALKQPQDADLVFLFEENEPAQKAALPASPGRQVLVKGSFACGALLLMLAAGLVATPRGRETLRRVLNRRPVFTDHYDLLAETGRDTLSVFHEARDRRLDRLVAVRRLDAGVDPERRRAFIAQAKALAAKGKDVVEVYAVYDDPADAWLVFERLERSAKAQRAKGLASLDPVAAQAALELLSLSKDSV